MSIENEISKLTTAVEALTAAMAAQTKAEGCCKAPGPSQPAAVPEKPAAVSPASNVPADVTPTPPAAPAPAPVRTAPQAPAAPAAPEVPAAPPAPAQPALTETDVKAMVAPPPVPAKNESVVMTPKLTETDVNARLVAKAEALVAAGRDGAAEITAVLGQFGATGVRSLDPSKWGELVAAVEAL